MTYVVNDTIYARFYVGTTGLASGAFTKASHVNGSVSGQTVTIVEDALGYYFASFPAVSAGNWGLRIDYNDFHFSAHFSVSRHLLDEDVTSFVVSKSVGQWLDIIKKYVRNRLKITGSAYDVYDDDGSTVYESGTTSTTERTPP